MLAGRRRRISSSTAFGGDRVGRLALRALPAPRPQPLELLPVDRLGLLGRRSAGLRASRAPMTGVRRGAGRARPAAVRHALELGVGLADIAASAARAALLLVAEVVEDLPAPADLGAGAVALDRAVGLPSAVLRRLDRRLGLPRAALPGEPHEQPFAAARLELHRARPLGDRQQHPARARRARHGRSRPSRRSAPRRRRAT